MHSQYVYRPPPQYRPQLYQPRPIEPYTLRWLFSRATQQYIRLTEPGGGWDAQSIPHGASPAVVTGDILVTPLITTPGSYTITLNADGIVSFDSGGDPSRQSFVADVYDTSLATFYGAATFYVGNQAPSYIGNNVVITLPRNQAITPVSLGDYWTDPESDAVTIDNVTALAGTLDVSGNELTGSTPDENRIDVETFRGTDIAGDSDDGDITLVIGQVTVPDVDNAGTTEGAAISTIEAAFLVASVTYEYSASIPEDEVISQSPAAGSLADPGSTVTLTVSLGELPEGAMDTLFLDDATPVPAGVYYRNGLAYSAAGELYVALWPASEIVYYVGGMARRSDGALIINPAGVVAAYVAGVALTSRGEVIAAAEPVEMFLNGRGLLNDGSWCMTEVT
jgi:hypothetical protein